MRTATAALEGLLVALAREVPPEPAFFSAALGAARGEPGVSPRDDGTSTVFCRL